MGCCCSSNCTESVTSAVDDKKPTSQEPAEEEEKLPPLDPSKTALVLIEYQNEFTTEGGALHDAVKECMEKTGTIANSKKVMDKARDAGCTIIHVPIEFDEVRYIGHYYHCGIYISKIHDLVLIFI